MCFTVFKILILAVAIFCASATFIRLKSTEATYKRRLLSFARFSLSSWILWAIQCLIVPGPLESARTGVLLDTGLWLSVMQNALWISAAMSLRSKQFPRLSDRLPLFRIFPIVLVLALGTYRITVLDSLGFVWIEGFVTAVFFMILSHSIWQWRLSRIYDWVFFIHGSTQWIWRSLWFGPLTGKLIVIFWTHPIWRGVFLVAWIKLILAVVHRAESSQRKVRKTIEGLGLRKPLDTITLMIGSTVEDLAAEREAAALSTRNLGLTDFGAESFSTPSQPMRDVYTYLAEECHIFILIIGECYGSRIERDGISVVEFQYEAARRQNPEKILVYVKGEVIREPQLQSFLTRVEDSSPRIIKGFITPEELYEEIQRGIAEWLTLHGSQLK